MADIDISVAYPPKREKNAKEFLKAFLFYFVQWTWGFLVNFPAALMFLYWVLIKKCRWQRFDYNFIVYIPWKKGGMSMGTFVFLRENHPDPVWTYNSRIHEYGHTWQCLVLGPLFYLVVAIPSAIWYNFFAGYREKNQVSYYKLYCESWANNWGMKVTGMPMKLDKLFTNGVQYTNGR